MRWSCISTTWEYCDLPKTKWSSLTITGLPGLVETAINIRPPTFGSTVGMCAPHLQWVSKIFSQYYIFMTPTNLFERSCAEDDSEKWAIPVGEISALSCFFLENLCKYTRISSFLSRSQVSPGDALHPKWIQKQRISGDYLCRVSWLNVSDILCLLLWRPLKWMIIFFQFPFFSFCGKTEAARSRQRPPHINW